MITNLTSRYIKIYNHNSQFLIGVTLLFISLDLTGCNNKGFILFTTPTSELIVNNPSTVSPIQQITDSPPIQPSPISVPVPTFETITGIYHHPDDLYNLLVPETWSISQSQNSSAFTDPEGETTIYAQVINSGYTLDDDSLWRFIEARERNVFAIYDNYIEIDRQNDESKGSILIKKQFLEHGEQKSVATVYQQQGQAIIILELRTNLNDYETYQELFDSILESTAINTEAVSNMQSYSTDIENYFKNDYFSFRFPPYWKNEQTSGEYSVVNTIYSPDESAIIQAVIYDDGQYLSGMLVGELVRTLLREQYTKDLTISSDNILIDGRERLTWKSNLANYQGVTLFEIRDTALLMVTVMWENEFIEYYQMILNDVINTYKVNLSNGE